VGQQVARTTAQSSKVVPHIVNNLELQNLIFSHGLRSAGRIGDIVHVPTGYADDDGFSGEPDASENSCQPVVPVDTPVDTPSEGASGEPDASENSWQSEPDTPSEGTSEEPGLESEGIGPLGLVIGVGESLLEFVEGAADPLAPIIYEAGATATEWIVDHLKEVSLDPDAASPPSAPVDAGAPSGGAPSGSTPNPDADNNSNANPHRPINPANYPKPDGPNGGNAGIVVGMHEAMTGLMGAQTSSSGLAEAHG
jgi:hypothetical protein